MGIKVFFSVLFSIMITLGLITTSGAHQAVVVTSASITPYTEAVEGFKKACNCNITEFSLAESDRTAFRQLIREQKPGLILTVGIDAMTEVAHATDLPIIYAMVPNAQLPGTLARNISGVGMHITPEKYLAAMLDLFPESKRIGIVYDPKNLDAFVKEAEQMARKRGVQLVPRKVSRANEVPAAVDALMHKVDVFWMLPDMTVINAESFKYLLAVTYQHNLPVFSFSRKYVEMGAAAGLYAVPADIGIQAAEIAKRIFTENSVYGPVRVDAKKTDLIVNDRIIRKLGTAVNADAIRRAGHVQ